MRARFVLLLFVVAGLLSTRRASAHDVRGELVFLDVGEHVVGVEVQIPTTQLRAEAPELFPGENHDYRSLRLDAVPAHVQARLFAEDRERHRFTTLVDDVRTAVVDDHPVIVVTARLDAPAGSDARWFELHDDIVLEHVVTHSAYVFLRRDLRAGELGESASLLGELHYQQRSLVVDREAAGTAAALRHAFALGMRHIAEGPDHLLFLAMLLLTVPMTARARRWHAEDSVRRAGVGALKIVSAFTIGHSATLVVATLSGGVLSGSASRVVEVGVAVSVLVTAVHAFRPLVPRHEAYLAAGFGLIHGLAFSSALTGFGFDRSTSAIALFGFNLGVEAMQLVVVCVVLPLLVLARRSTAYAWLRRAGAGVGALAASFWIVDRLGGHAPWLIGGLALAVIVDALARRVASASPRGGPDRGKA